MENLSLQVIRQGGMIEEKLSRPEVQLPESWFARVTTLPAKPEDIRIS
jgi:hypothetical protein